jgi:hypothetical protein
MNEIKKYHTITSVSEGKKKKERASVELGLTRHQVKHLLNSYEAKGTGTQNLSIPYQR